MTRQRLIRVLSIRSSNPLGHGGCIFFGIEIDESGTTLLTQNQFVVVASGRLLLETLVEVGQWWQVIGEAIPHTRTVNGFSVTEQQIEAEDLQMTLPTGRHIITLLSEGERFVGIGNAKATRLWEAFGEALPDLLDRGETGMLSAVQGVSPEAAIKLIEAWRAYGAEPTLHWLYKHGFNAALGKKIIEHFGTETPKLIEEDPYRLLSFLAGWKTTDRFARVHFGIALSDPRRLQGAIEEALYRLFSDGHTAASQQMVMIRLASILEDQTPEFRWRYLAAKSLESGLTNGSYIVGQNDQFLQIGAYVMESTVAKALSMRVERDNNNCCSVDAPVIDEIINSFEIDEQLRLTAEQRSAVHMAANHSFALLTGGAGTGKTIVLKAIYRVYDKMDLKIIQAAVAGRAAERMHEATNRSASTIASFLLRTSDDDLKNPCVLVLDEGSMVDIISMYRIAHLLPQHARILMVGDPHQLMPVGPGLVLHTLVNVPRIPNTELRVVKRHGDAIANAAASVRDGFWPKMSDNESDAIAFLASKPGLPIDTKRQQSAIESEVLRLYLTSPSTTQILSPWKKGDAGVHALNALCQNQLSSNKPKLMMWNKEFDCMVETQLRLGDPVVCTRNLWDKGLQNGSLGRLMVIESPPVAVLDSYGVVEGFAIGWVDWDDGIRRPVTQELLHYLELAYALTVHKAQGSQWSRVIVPITSHRLLDRSLIYTAITRAQHQILLLGDETAARLAVEDLPRSYSRQTALFEHLQCKLMESDHR